MARFELELTRVLTRFKLELTRVLLDLTRIFFVLLEFIRVKTRVILGFCANRVVSEL